MEIYDDDEEERKLSTIQEVSESRDISSPSMFAENCRNRSRKSISSDSDQVMDVSLNNYKRKTKKIFKNSVRTVDKYLFGIIIINIGRINIFLLRFYTQGVNFSNLYFYTFFLESGDPVRKNRMGTISCISDKVVCYKTEANIFPSEDQTFHVYSDSPTFSDFSS